MLPLRLPAALALCAATLLLATPVRAADPAPAPAPKVLLDVTAKGAAERLTPTSAQVSVAPSADAKAPGLVVSIKAGDEGYPGVKLKPAGNATWDLATTGHVAAKVTNLGSAPLSVALRVDNAGDWKKEPWNTELVTVKPGASAVVSVVYGYQYGHKPGFALKPAEVTQVMVFVNKVTADLQFRLESLTAAGSPGETPVAGQ